MIVTDVRDRLKMLFPHYNNIDATIYDSWTLLAIKFALLQKQSGYLAGEDTFLLKSTMSGSAQSTGTTVINTTIGDGFYVALIAGAQRIAGNTIWIYNGGTAKFNAVPRVSMDLIIIGGTGETIVAFNEVNGALEIYIKDATFTTIPADMHYIYWRKLDVPTTGSSVIDIKADDETDFVDLVVQFMPE